MARKIVCSLLVLYLLLIAGCGGSSTPTPTPTPTPTITGAWAGSFTSQVANSTFAISGNFVQGAINPDGTILFSGSIKNPAGCVQLLQISGKIFGGSFALTGTFSDGTTLDITATINPSDTVITGNYNSVGGTVCSSDHGTFSLTKQ